MGFVSEHSIAIAAGQVLIAGFEGTTLPALIHQSIAESRLGGVIIFKRNIESLSQIHALIHTCHTISSTDFPLLISVDQEGGRVRRLPEPVLQLPPMRQLGQWDDPSFTQRAAYALSLQLRTLGFTMNHAPVLDVDTNPANPIIADRAFGTDVETVVRHATAFIQGTRDAMVLNCGKHFPGHGDTTLDSHEALPQLKHSLERLKAVELAPFRLLAPMLDAVMSAHIVYQGIDALHPATLSPTIIQSLLREHCGFQGCVLSDDLEMKAISNTYTIPEAAYHAIVAGCDALLICRDTPMVYKTRDYLKERAMQEPDFAQRLLDAAQRFINLRRSVHPPSLTDNFTLEQLHPPEVIEVRQELESRLKTL